MLSDQRPECSARMGVLPVQVIQQRRAGDVPRLRPRAMSGGGVMPEMQLARLIEWTEAASSAFHSDPATSWTLHGMGLLMIRLRHAPPTSLPSLTSYQLEALARGVEYIIGRGLDEDGRHGP